MATVAELTKLIDEGPMPKRLKAWAKKRLVTFKQQRKLLEWSEKLRNINAERPKVNNRREFQRYKPEWRQVTVNVYCPRDNTSYGALHGTRYFTDGGGDFGNLERTYHNEDEDRELVLPAWFIDKYAKEQRDVYQNGSSIGNRKFLVNAAEFVRAASAVCSRSSLDNLVSTRNFTRSHDIEIELISVAKVPQQLPARTLRGPADRPLRAGDRRMTHRMLDYPAKSAANSFDEMFEVPTHFVDQACMYTAIMETWADAYNKRTKTEPSGRGGRPRKMDLSHETIHRIVFPILPFDPNNLRPMSFNEAKKVFEYLKVEARLYDSASVLTGTPIDRYVPPTSKKPESNESKKRVLSIIVKDDHAYYIPQSRTKKTVTDREKRPEMTGTMSARYPVTRGDAPTFSGVLSNVDELWPMTQALAREAIAGKKKVLELRYMWRNDDLTLMNALNDVFHKYNWLPSARVGSHDRIESFSIRYEVEGLPVHVTVFSPDLGQYARTDLKSVTAEQIQLVFDFQHKLRKCNNRRLMSQYGPGVAETLKAMRRAPDYFKVVDVPDGDYDCVDQKRCYTNIVKSVAHFPKFADNDVFRPYDGHELEALTLYLARYVGPMTTDMKALFGDDRVLMYGHFLAGYEVEIESFLRPHKLVPNPYLEVLQEIEDSDLPDFLKKLIPNVNWGLLGKVRNTNKSTTLCATFEEALFANLPRCRADGPKGSVTKVTGTEFYKVTQHNEAELVEGFLPLQHLIYNSARERLAGLIRKVGLKNTIGVHTDCVYVKKLPNKVPAGCRFERAKKMACKVFAQGTNEFKPLIPLRPKANEYTFDDEYAPGFADEVLERSPRIFAKSKYPGAGKTQLAIDFLKRHGITDFIVACPSWAQARKHRNGVTMYKLCGRIVDENMKVNQAMTAKYVIFEEIGQWNYTDWRNAIYYMKMNPNTRFIATGDLHQCEPIDECWNPDCDTMEFYTDLMHTHFPDHINLDVIKRQADPQAIYDMHDDMWVKKLPPQEVLEKYTKYGTVEGATNIAYRNEVVEYVNTVVHGTKAEYYEGLRLVCRVDSIGKGPTAIRKNYELLIRELTDTHVTFYDEVLEHLHAPIDRSFLKHFDYTYAYTVHKIQGESFDGPVVIYDYDYHYVSRNWAWVALTRARDPSQMYRFKSPFTSQLNRSALQKLVTGYTRQDVAAGRKTDITVDWILEQFKKQNGRCYNPRGCGSVTLRIPKSTRKFDDDMLTVDRVSSEPGHLKFNCQLCCLQCNRSKKAAELEE